MRRLKLRATARVAAVLAVSTALLTLGNLVTTPGPAGADPMFKSAYVGVGSDTLQDLFNAFSGAAPYPPPSGVAATFYTPVHSSAASGSKTITSWDAVDPGTGQPGCVIPGLGKPQIDRPNGSGAGVKALSRAVDQGAWAPTTNCGATSTSTNNVNGSIDFARSSAAPSSFPTGTQLTFIPIARDAVTYAYFAKGATGTPAVANLTSAQLQQLYGTAGASTSGKITVGSETIFACMVQSSSGTGKFWDKAMGNVGDGATATASANASGCGSTYEENGANSFSTSTFVSALTAGQDVVIPFSAGSWISQLNGTAADRSSTGNTNGVNLGTPDGVAPTTGTKPNLAPNPTYYSGGTYGRDLFVVVPTSKIGTFGDAGLKSLFVGGTSALCSATTTIRAFGFETATVSGACGSTTQTTGLS
jgi:hypothetical protein